MLKLKTDEVGNREGRSRKKHTTLLRNFIDLCRWRNFRRLNALWSRRHLWRESCQRGHTAHCLVLTTIAEGSAGAWAVIVIDELNWWCRLIGMVLKVLVRCLFAKVDWRRWYKYCGE